MEINKMPNTIQPVSPFIGMAKEAIERFDDKSNTVITKSLGDVEKCVVGYSSREGFFGKLGGVVYRMWNAVKAIFGQSDWQKSRRALKTLQVKLLELPVSKKLMAFAVENGADYMNLPPEAKNISAHMLTGMVSAMIKEYKPTNKELDDALKDFIKVNENQGMKNIVNHPQVQKIVGDGKQVVGIVKGLYGIFESKMPMIKEMVAEKNIAKAIQLFVENSAAVAQIEGLTHLVEPLLDILPTVGEKVEGGETQAALGLIFTSVPAIEELFTLYVTNQPKLAK
jgi:hypothetical protein